MHNMSLRLWRHVITCCSVLSGLRYKTATWTPRYTHYGQMGLMDGRAEGRTMGQNGTDLNGRAGLMNGRADGHTMDGQA
jgi:hypothetical protein